MKDNPHTNKRLNVFPPKNFVPILAIRLSSTDTHRHVISFGVDRFCDGIIRQRALSLPEEKCGKSLSTVNSAPLGRTSISPFHRRGDNCSLRYKTKSRNLTDRLDVHSLFLLQLNTVTFQQKHRRHQHQQQQPT